MASTALKVPVLKGPVVQMVAGWAAVPDGLK
jgi:hypothetical protein